MHINRIVYMVCLYANAQVYMPVLYLTYISCFYAYHLIKPLNMHGCVLSSKHACMRRGIQTHVCASTHLMHTDWFKF